MKKIVYLALHLGYGGVERAIISQANLLCEDFDIEIISTYKLYEIPSFFVNDRVNITYLIENLKPNRDAFFNAIKSWKFKQILREIFISFKVLYFKKRNMIKAIKNINSDYVISTRCIYNKWLSKHIKCNAIKIAQEHRHHNFDKRYIKKLIYSLKNIDYLMPVSKQLTNFYTSKLEGKHTQCIYIPNFLNVISNNISDLNNKQITSVGRFSPEKGFLDLVSMFYLVKNKNPDWKLNIIGDGQQKELIEKKIKELKLEKNVILHGYQQQEYIKNILLHSSIYVITSYEESFGLTLIEAQSYGLPCLAFDSAQGAAEIITDNLDGFLIPNRDKDLMAYKINYLINNENIRKTFGIESRKNSFKFSKDRIFDMWINFLERN